MAIYKCKMCGGALDIPAGLTTATCAYCGTAQTLPKFDDDKRSSLYERASLLRRNNEFDKAEALYEQILSEDSTDAESYWSLVLCRYGIEYVESPSGMRVPTVNRAQYTSIFDDANYKSALRYADINQRMIYEQEANAINEIQKGILAISANEKPFDVFICYKEKDESGERTRDSVIAQELYHELTEEGFKVFFARITLEDKLGSAYEPYIFAALNSAKVMVVLGTKPQYFEAVWVKNEWSRYLALVKQSGGKKMLIPAYRDMDAYDLPEEFSHLQAQDMSKLGFMQDLVRGIRKLVGNAAPIASAGYNPAYSTQTEPLLRRVQIFMDGGDFESANIYCEKILDIDPENSKAYIYKLMARLGVATEAQIIKSAEPLDTMTEYKNALRFSDNATAERLIEYNKIIREKFDASQKQAEAQRLADNLRREEERRAAQKREEAMRREKQEKERLRAEEAARRAAFDAQNAHIYAMERKEALLKQKKKKTFWGIVWLIIWWPIGIYNLYRASQIGKEIDKL